MLTRDQVRKLRTELDATLRKLNIKGWKCQLANATFGETVTFKLECLPVAKDGTTTSKEAGAYKMHHRAFNLPADGLGSEFVCGGETYTVDGLNIRKRRAPVLAKRVDGRRFCFAAETVAALLGAPRGAKPARR